MIARTAIVASVTWLCIVEIVSSLSRHFDWFEFYVGSYHLGPASYLALAGVGVIAALAVGVPWIMAAKR